MKNLILLLTIFIFNNAFANDELFAEAFENLDNRLIEVDPDQVGKCRNDNLFLNGILPGATMVTAIGGFYGILNKRWAIAESVTAANNANALTKAITAYGKLMEESSEQALR